MKGQRRAEIESQAEPVYPTPTGSKRSGLPSSRGISAAANAGLLETSTFDGRRRRRALVSLSPIWLTAEAFCGCYHDRGPDPLLVKDHLSVRDRTSEACNLGLGCHRSTHNGPARCLRRMGQNWMLDRRGRHLRSRHRLGQGHLTG